MFFFRLLRFNEYYCRHPTMSSLKTHKLTPKNLHLRERTGFILAFESNKSISLLRNYNGISDKKRFLETNTSQSLG